MVLQIPELLEPDIGYIDNVGAHGDGHLGVFAIKELGAEGHIKTREVLVEGEESEKTGLGLAVCLRIGKGRLGSFALVLADGLGVEVLDFEDVEGNTPTITAACPLGILQQEE